MTIVRTYETLWQTRSLTRKRQKGAVLDEDVRTNIFSDFSTDVHASLRAMSTEAGVPKSSLWWILRRAAIFVCTTCSSTKINSRTDFAHRMLIKMEEDQEFLNHILWTDDANFSRNAQININNAHYWSETNPHWLSQVRHQYQQSFGIWCGIYDGTLVDPAFLDRTLTTEMYINEILKGPVDDFRDDVSLARIGHAWLHQDGAPARSSSVARDCLDEAFPQQWIGRHGPVTWQRSPDMTPPPQAFILLGYIKDRVYRTLTTTSDDLKAKISQVYRAIPETVIRSVTVCVLARCQSCIDADGDLFEPTW